MGSLCWVSKFSVVDCNQGFLFGIPSFKRGTSWKCFFALRIGSPCLMLQPGNGCSISPNCGLCSVDVVLLQHGVFVVCRMLCFGCAHFGHGQNLTMGDSDDMCVICGDGGDLILCNGCPGAFHAACFDSPTVPASDWRCLNCKDNTDDEGGVRPIMMRLTRVDKEPKYEMDGCVVCRENDFGVDKFDDQIVTICDQCEKEYHVVCLRNVWAT